MIKGIEDGIAGLEINSGAWDEVSISSDCTKPG